MALGFLQTRFRLLGYISKVGDCSGKQPEGSIFHSYYTEV